MLKIILIYAFLLVHVLSEMLINQTSIISYEFPQQDNIDSIKMFPSGHKVLLLNEDGLIRSMDL